MKTSIKPDLKDYFKLLISLYANGLPQRLIKKKILKTLLSILF